MCECCRSLDILESLSVYPKLPTIGDPDVIVGFLASWLFNLRFIEPLSSKFDPLEDVPETNWLFLSFGQAITYRPRMNDFLEQKMKRRCQLYLAGNS